MEKAYIEKMKKNLLNMKKEILQHLAAENAEFHEIVEDTDPKDLADIASDDIDRRILEALGNQELKTLKLIENALARIENGRYGKCMRCDEKIPRERLEAIPYAVLCIKCKTSEELRNR
jgi:DnaK suppressor protein